MRTADIPRVRTTLAVFKVSAIVTGVLLLGVVVMMVTRYGFGVDIAVSQAQGLHLAPRDLIEEQGSLNISLILLTLHGWLYVVYVALDFMLWRLLRWPFTRFVFVALGGIIPGLSFYFERAVPRDAEAAISAETPIAHEGATA